MYRALVLPLALIVGMSAGPAAAQLDILGGKRLTDPAGRLAAGNETPSLAATAVILPASGPTPARLAITARLAPGWHTYSITQPPGGPTKTKIKLAPSNDFRLMGQFQADPPPAVHQDPAFPGLNAEEHSGAVTWSAPIELATGVDPKRLRIEGAVNAQVCAESCVPPQDYKFAATLASNPPATAETDARQSAASLRAAGASVAGSTIQDASGEAPADAVQQPGEQNFRSGHATIRGAIEPAVVSPGGRARLTLTATPESPFYVYALANRPTETPGAGQPTLIDVTPREGLKFGSPLPSSPPTAGDHPGEVTWTIDISVDPQTAAGDIPIAGLIGFQTCTESRCDRPAGARFSGTLAVGRAAAGPTALEFTPAKYDEVARLAAARPDLPADEFGVVDVGSESAGLPLMILLSLVGGLILNLMPCVLPVIGLKVLAFVEQAGQHRSRVILLNLWYTAGILAVFMILATLATTLNFGWGQQFSSTRFNIFMASVVFAMALSFLGFWEIPIPGFVGSGGAAHVAAREGAIGAFAKGVLTTVLATPCSGPFLGSVFGFTLKQPPYVTFLIFGSIGLGMASPYLLIGAFPRLIRYLPKPGAWMETFKQLLAFMLLGTVVFMFSFLDRDYLVPTFALLIGIWAACWWIGRTPLTYSPRRRALVWLEGAAVAAIVGSFAFTWLVPRPSLLEWQPFSRPTLAELRQDGKTVMIDFTAEWCPNCKLNMLTAINTQGVRDIVHANGVVPLLADWTKESPEIKQMLASLNMKSIPVLAIFPAGKNGPPIVLRDVITQGQLIAALKEAGPSQDRRHAAAGRQPVRSFEAADADLSRH